NADRVERVHRADRVSHLPEPYHESAHSQRRRDNGYSVVADTPPNRLPCTPDRTVLPEDFVERHLCSNSWASAQAPSDGGNGDSDEEYSGESPGRAHYPPWPRERSRATFPVPSVCWPPLAKGEIGRAHV